MLIDSAALTRLSLLKAIRRHGPVSRVELGGITGLSKGAVSAMVAELIASELVVEEDSASRERGRPRVPLSIRTDSVFVVGASLDEYGMLELCLVDLAGHLVERESAATQPHGDLEGFVAWLANALERFVKNGPIARSQIASVAVAIPGTVESSTGVLLWFPTLAGEEVQAARMLSERTGLSVIIENDVDCLARAEHWFADGAGLDDFTIVYQGGSVGLAQYADGLPRTGLSGANAEFGHVKTDYGPEARTCFCGGRGCLTTYSSYLGLFVSSGGKQFEPGDGAREVLGAAPALIEAAERGKGQALAAFAVAGRHLGLALANYINTQDPERILIRTADPKVAAFIETSLRDAVSEGALPAMARRTAIEIGAAPKDWRWKGTAALALEQAYLGQAVRQARLASRVASPTHSDSIGEIAE